MSSPESFKPKRIESLYAVEKRAGTALDKPLFWKPAELASQLDRPALDAINKSVPQERPKLRAINRGIGDQIISDATESLADNPTELATSLLLARRTTSEQTGMFHGLIVRFKGDRNDTHAFSQNLVTVAHPAFPQQISMQAYDMVKTVRSATWMTYGADELLKFLVFDGGMEVVSEAHADTIWRKVRELQSLRHERIANFEENKGLNELDAKIGLSLLRSWADIKNKKNEPDGVGMTAAVVFRSGSKIPQINLDVQRGPEHVLVDIPVKPGNVDGLRLKIKGASAVLDDRKILR